MYWIVVYLCMARLAGGNEPPTEAGSVSLEKWWWLLAVPLTPLTFLTFAFPWAGRWWWLVRVNVSVLLGLVISAYVITAAVDYQDSRNSGTFAGWVLSVMFGGIVVLGFDALAAVMLAWRGRVGKLDRAA